MIRRWMVWFLLAAAGIGCNESVASPPAWQALDPAACIAPAKAGIHAKLDAAWTAFQPYVRACPLALHSRQARVWLLTIFAQDYLDAHPETTTWPTFPRPMLVDNHGTCLASLPELFPFDEPRTLRLDFGRSMDGIPSTVRVRVSNPAVGGDYTLPLLRWSPEQQAYMAARGTDLYTTKDMTCPN